MILIDEGKFRLKCDNTEKKHQKNKNVKAYENDIFQPNEKEDETRLNEKFHKIMKIEVK